MKLLIPITYLALTGIALAGNAESSKSQICYLPTESNVAYSDVTSLPTDSPAEVISYADEDLHFGELWLPESRGQQINAPLIVFVHGGCWLNAFDISHSHALSSALTQAGYAVWSIEYRRTGDTGGGWPGSFDDVKSAIDHLDKLTGFPIDTRRITLVGHSAGGHLALLAAADMQQRVAAVIGLAAIVDIEAYAKGDNSCQSATPKFMGGLAAEIPTEYDAANPVKQTLHPNTTLIHGNADAIVPLTQATSSSVAPIVIEGAGHFDMIHPGTPAFKVLLRELARLYP